MRGSPEPLITVAIPTYNRYNYLSEAISSALSQNYRSIEVIISDDGKESETERVVREFLRDDPRIRYWKNRSNLGLAGNWNKCVDEARGEYTLIIGDDDRLLPNGLAPLIEGGSEDVLFGTHFLIDALGNRLDEQSIKHNDTYGRSSLKPGPLSAPELVVWNNSIPMCGALVRTKLARQHRFKEDTNTPELIFFAELAAQGATFRYQNTLVSEYRIHDKSATTSGLWNDKLANHLIGIPVSPTAEARKKRTLEPIIVNAINLCMAKGTLEEARRLANTQFYPNPLSHPRVAVQRICLLLPSALGATILRLAINLKQRISKRCRQT